MSPGLNKQSKLRSYNSILGKEKDRDLLEYAAQAESYMRRLWSEQPDLMSLYREEFVEKKKKVGGDKEES